MSKSLNELVGSIFNLSDIFASSANFISLGQDNRGREIASKLIDFKGEFNKKADFANLLIKYYYNRYVTLKMSYGNDSDSRKKKELEILETITNQLELYKYCCEQFALKKSIGDIEGFNKLIEICDDLNKSIEKYEESNSEIGMIDGEDTIIKTYFEKYLSYFFGTKFSGNNSTKNKAESANQFLLGFLWQQFEIKTPRLQHDL